MLSKAQYPEAVLALQHATEQDVFHLPRLSLLRNQFDAALLASRNDVAKMACETGATEAPDDVRFRDGDVQLWSRAGADRRLAAIPRAKADSLAVYDAGTLFRARRELWVAEILTRTGFGDSADAVTRRATADAPGAWWPILFPETAYLRLLRGDPDSAIVLIAATVRQDPTAGRLLRSDPRFLSLYPDPRFVAAVGRGATPR